MTTRILSQSRLKELLYYNKQFGIFVWKKDKARASAGEIAGGIDKQGYNTVGIDGKTYMLHRLVFLYVKGKFPDSQVDHINGIRRDNRFSNLREVTHQENQRNRKKNNNNTSGVTGVYVYKDDGPWTTIIIVDGRRITETHTDFFEACCVRKSAELKLNYHPNHGRRA